MWREPGYLFLIVLAATLFVVAVVFPPVEWLRERRRRRALRSLAARLGLHYSSRGRWLLDRYPLLDAGGVARRSDAGNVLSGALGGHTVFAFDYHPRGRGALDDDNTPAKAGLLLDHEASLPKLSICPSTLAAKLHQPIGRPSIDFESVEFSKAFIVTAENRKFAYAICHPRMMAYLLRHPNLHVEIDGSCVAIICRYRLAVEEIPRRLRQLIEIRKLLPGYLFDGRRRGEA